MPTKKRVQYRYTPTGQRAAMIDPDGGRFTYLYDSVKQLTAVINPQGQRTSYSYDLAGRRTVKKLANGSRTSFSYDLASRLTSVAHLKSDSSVQGQFNYRYDRVGNRTGVTELDGSRVTYLYDAAYQLTGEHRTGTNSYRNTYTYDNRGNRTLKNLDGVRTTSAYDDANQLKWSEAPGGRTTYIFDANGNQEVVLTPAGARTTNIWDYENRLIGVLHPGGSRETMAYDPDGKRIKHQTASETAKFVWDGQAYLLEFDASGITIATYTNEPTRYGRLISQRKSGATHYYLFDALGSTRLVTDASQSVAESLVYDAWGNLVSSSPSMAVPFRWVGELGYLFVPSSGDYHIRERILRPTIGRWLSKDPMPIVYSLNQFQYVSSRVVIAIDPSGLQWQLPPGALTPPPRPRREPEPPTSTELPPQYSYPYFPGKPVDLRPIVPFPMARDEEPAGPDCPGWNSGGFWSFENIRVSNIQYWGEMSDREGHYWNAGSWAKYEIDVDPVLEGRLCCLDECNREQYVDISLTCHIHAKILHKIEDRTTYLPRTLISMALPWRWKFLTVIPFVVNALENYWKYDNYLKALEASTRVTAGSSIDTLCYAATTLGVEEVSIDFGDINIEGKLLEDESDLPTYQTPRVYSPPDFSLPDQSVPY